MENEHNPTPYDKARLSLIDEINNIQKLIEKIRSTSSDDKADSDILFKIKTRFEVYLIPLAKICGLNAHAWDKIKDPPIDVFLKRLWNINSVAEEKQRVEVVKLFLDFTDYIGETGVYER